MYIISKSLIPALTLLIALLYRYEPVRTSLGITPAGVAPALPAKPVGPYGDTTVIAQALYRTINTKGIQVAISQYRAWRDGNGKSPDTELDNLGLYLLNEGKVSEAFEMFKLNAESFPNSVRANSSYAKGCLVMGDTENAVKYYQKTLKLNPDNPGVKNLLKQLTAVNHENGKVLFKLKGYKDAKYIALAGNFNRWNPFHTLLFRKDQEWIGSIDLPPGEYEYKFVVDGKWITDPANTRTKGSGVYTNSVVTVK